MEPTTSENIESLFESLPPKDKITIISHGIALYLSSLKKRLFLTQAKMHQFEEKYNISLDKLDNNGLPDAADYQMHKDYLMWHHWYAYIEKLQRQVGILDTPATHGLYTDEERYVSD